MKEVAQADQRTNPAATPDTSIPTRPPLLPDSMFFVSSSGFEKGKVKSSGVVFERPSRGKS